MRTLMVWLIGLGVATAAPPAQQLDGWWRTAVVMNDQEATFFLHFEADEDDAPIVSMSLPIMRVQDAPIGSYVATDSTLSLPGLSWELSIAADGAVIEGRMPASMVGDLEVAARFERSDAPPPPPVLIGAEEPPASAWTARVDAEVWAGLAYDTHHDLLFVGADDGRLSSFQGSTGETAWSKDLGAPIRATPTLHDGRIYVATDLALYVLEANTGDRVWSVSFGQPLSPRLAISEANARWDHYASSAAVDQDLVVVGARDGCVYALASASGTQRWRTCTEDIVTTTPAITDHAVFIGGFDGTAYALSRENGSQLWHHDTGAPIPSDAVLAGDTVLFGSRSSDLLALNAATGELVWKYYYWSSWIDAAPVVRDGVIYVGSSDLLAVLALDAGTGKERWSTPAPGWTWPRPAVGGSAVYVGAVGAAQYWSPREAALLCLDRQTGALRWIFRPEHTEGNPLFGFASSPVVDDIRVFAVDLEGVIYAFDDP